MVVLALPGRLGANVPGWATKKLSAFIVTCIHIHRHSIGLSSFFVLLCFRCIRLSHHFHPSSSSLPATIFNMFTHLESQFYSPISSVACNVIVTFAHLHRHFSHRHFPSIGHHLFLTSPLFLLIVSSGALFITWMANCTIKTHTIFSITRTAN